MKEKMRVHCISMGIRCYKSSKIQCAAKQLFLYTSGASRKPRTNKSTVRIRYVFQEEELPLWHIGGSKLKLTCALLLCMVQNWTSGYTESY